MRIKEIIGTRSIASVGRRAFDPSMEYAPSIRDGLLWVAPLRDNAPSIYDNGVVAYVDPSDQDVDADGTYIDSYGIMQDAILDVLRIEKNGALLEALRENIQTYSEDITNSAYGALDCSKAGNVTTGPDGKLTADQIVEDSGLSAHRIYSAHTWDGSSEYTISAFVKDAGRPGFRISFANLNFVGSPFAYFDLAAGIVGTTASCTAKIKSLGNGWYLVEATATSDSAGFASYSLWTVDAGETLSYTGDGSSGVYIVDIQVEKGGFASSRIPTEGSAVTRTQDDLRYALSGNMSTGAGTFIMAVTPHTIGTNGHFLNTVNGSAEEGIIIQYLAGTNVVRTLFYIGSSIAIALGTTALVIGQTYIFVATWESGSQKFYVDGALEGTDTDVGVPAHDGDSIYVGLAQTQTFPGESNSAHLLSYNRVLDLAEVVAATTEIQGWMA